MEGASPGARNICSPDGHSNDGTLKILEDIKNEEDPENKIQIITAEDEGYSNGFWPGEKDEQSRAYAKRATGNYLWQVDVDEFYKTEDIRSVIDLLADDPSISAVSFRQIQFWGGFNHIVDSWFLRRGVQDFHRLFKWDNSYQYTTHRPPTVVDEERTNLREKHWITPQQLMKKGIYLYHYSYVFPKQVKEKASYYSNAKWAKRPDTLSWYENNFLNLKNPYRLFIVYNSWGWIEKFSFSHPEQIQQMINDIKTGDLQIELRGQEDIQRLNNKLLYRTGIILLKICEPVDLFLKMYYQSIKRKLKRIMEWLIL